MALSSPSFGLASSSSSSTSSVPTVDPNGGTTPLQWRHVQPNDAGRPDGRWGHSTLLVGDKYIVIVGGLQAGRTLNDAWVFNLENQKWARCLVVGTPPTPRWGHSSTLAAPHTLLLLGGREGSKPMSMGEYYELDLKTMTWTKKETVQPAPRSRYAHGVVSLGLATRQLLLFGGHGGRSRYYNDVHILQLPHNSNGGTNNNNSSSSNKSTTTDPLAYPFLSHSNTTPHSVSSSSLSTNSTFTSSNMPLNTGFSTSSNLPLSTIIANDEFTASSFSVIGNTNNTTSTNNHVNVTVPQLSAVSNSLMQTIFNTNWLKSVGNNNSNNTNNNTTSEDTDHLSTSTAPSSSLPHNTNGTTNQGEGIWLTPHVTGNPPSKRSGHTTTLCGNRLFIIGGYNGKDILNDLGILHLSTWSWSSPLVTGSGLPPLVGHCADSIPNSNQIVIFGGSVSATELSCSIYVLDADILASTALHHAQAPEARFWHRSVVISVPSTRPMQGNKNLLTQENTTRSSDVPVFTNKSTFNSSSTNDTDANILSPVGYILSGVRSENNTDASVQRSDATADSTFVAEGNLSVADTYISSDNSSLSGRNNTTDNNNGKEVNSTTHGQFIGGRNVTGSPEKISTHSSQSVSNNNGKLSMNKVNSSSTTVTPNPRDYFVFVFGGSGERGQAYNDIHLLDVSALAHGEDLTETLALASSSKSSSSSTNASSKSLFGNPTNDTGLNNGLIDHDRGFSTSSFFSNDGLSYAVSNHPTDSNPGTLNYMHSNHNFLSKDTESGYSTTDTKIENSNGGGGTGSENNSGLVIGLVTRRATAPSMAVGLGGVGKMISIRNSTSSHPLCNNSNNNENSIFGGNSGSPTGSTISTNPSTLHSHQQGMYASSGYSTNNNNNGNANHSIPYDNSINYNNNGSNNHHHRRFMTSTTNNGNNNNYPGMMMNTNNSHPYTGNNRHGNNNKMMMDPEFSNHPNYPYHQSESMPRNTNTMMMNNRINNGNSRGMVHNGNNNNNRFSNNSSSNNIMKGPPLPPPLPSTMMQSSSSVRNMVNNTNNNTFGPVHGNRLSMVQNSQQGSHIPNNSSNNYGIPFVQNDGTNYASSMKLMMPQQQQQQSNNTQRINNHNNGSTNPTTTNFNTMGRYSSNNTNGILMNNATNTSSVLGQGSLSNNFMYNDTLFINNNNDYGNSNAKNRSITNTTVTNNNNGNNYAHMHVLNEPLLQQQQQQRTSLQLSNLSSSLMNNTNGNISNNTNLSGSSLLFTNNNGNSNMNNTNNPLLLDPLLSSNDPLMNQLLLDTLRLSSNGINNSMNRTNDNYNDHDGSFLPFQNSLLSNNDSTNNLVNFSSLPSLSTLNNGTGRIPLSIPIKSNNSNGMDVLRGNSSNNSNTNNAMMMMMNRDDEEETKLYEQLRIALGTGNANLAATAAAAIASYRSRQQHQQSSGNDNNDSINNTLRNTSSISNDLFGIYNNNNNPKPMNSSNNSSGTNGTSTNMNNLSSLDNYFASLNLQ